MYIFIINIFINVYIYKYFRNIPSVQYMVKLKTFRKISLVPKKRELIMKLFGANDQSQM